MGACFALLSNRCLRGPNARRGKNSAIVFLVRAAVCALPIYVFNAPKIAGLSFFDLSYFQEGSARFANASLRDAPTMLSLR